MNSLSAGSLLRSSWGILKADKRMLAAQVTGMLVALILGAITVVGVLALGDVSFSENNYELSLGAPAVAFYVLAYLGITLVGTLVQAFVVSYSLARFRGKTVASSEVKEQVKKNMKGLVLFSLLTGTIGLILSYLEERLPLAGKIATWIAGAAWGIASMFAVAVIVDKDENNPLTATKKSAGVFKKTFGPNIKVNFGLGLVTLLGVLGIVTVGAIVTIMLFSIDSSAGSIAGVTSMGLSLLALVGLFLVISTLSSIIKAGLYEYASSGKAPDDFNEDMFKAAITEKKAHKIFS